MLKGHVLLASSRTKYSGMQISVSTAEAGSNIIAEGNDPDADIDEENVQVRAIRARIHLKSEKKKTMNFITTLDKNQFTGMANDLAKSRNNCPDNIVEAMQLAQTYRYDGRVMGDVITTQEILNDLLI